MLQRNREAVLFSGRSDAEAAAEALQRSGAADPATVEALRQGADLVFEDVCRSLVTTGALFGIPLGMVGGSIIVTVALLGMDATAEETIRLLVAGGLAGAFGGAFFGALAGIALIQLDQDGCAAWAALTPAPGEVLFVTGGGRDGARMMEVLLSHGGRRVPEPTDSALRRARRPTSAPVSDRASSPT